VVTFSDENNLRQWKIRPRQGPAIYGSPQTIGHLDFSLFSAVQGWFGGLKAAGSGLLEFSAA
jgi:hypothetical protein